MPDGPANSEVPIGFDNRGDSVFLAEYDAQYRKAVEIIDAPRVTDPNYRINVSPVYKNKGWEPIRSSISLRSLYQSGQVDLTPYLAEGYEIVPVSGQGQCLTDHKHKQILIDLGRPNKFSPLFKKGVVLDILHEFGHSHQEQPRPAAMKLSLRQNIELFKSTVRALATAFRERSQMSNLSLGERSRRLQLSDAKVKALLPNWLMDSWDTRSAKSERDAWAFALTKARELESKGFNVLSEFGSEQEVRDYIWANLFTYEYLRLLRMVQKGKGVNDYTPKFVKPKTSEAPIKSPEQADSTQ